MPDQPTTTLDLLETENATIEQLLAEWRGLQGQDVETRWERGTKDKLLLEHLALREASKHYLADGLRKLDHPDLADAMMGDADARISLIDELDHLMSGVQAMSIGTDVDDLVGRIDETLRPELHRDNDELIPAVRRDVNLIDLAGVVPDPSYVHRHSPTHPGHGNRWWQNVGPLERIHALYDHFRNEPGGAMRPSSDQSVADRVSQPLRHLGGGVPKGDTEPSHRVAPPVED